MTVLPAAKLAVCSMNGMVGVSSPAKGFDSDAGMCAGAVHVPHFDAGLHLCGAVPGSPGRQLHHPQPAPRLAALRLCILYISAGPARPSSSPASG